MNSELFEINYEFIKIFIGKIFIGKIFKVQYNITENNVKLLKNIIHKIKFCQ